MSERIVTRHITPHCAWQGSESEAPVSPAGEASVPKVYHIGDRTMAEVFEPAGLTNLYDLQAVFDQVERALSPAVDAVRLANDDESFDHILSDGLADVIAERHRQVEAEGWTPEHDDARDQFDLAEAAACYCLSAAGYEGDDAAITRLWPWLDEWWKPTTPRRDLVKAAALILAEIDRLDRAATKVES